MIFYECGGGAEEKPLSFRLSASNGTNGVFFNGRYWGGMTSKDQAFVPVKKDSTNIIYSATATRVIHVKFYVDYLGSSARDICGVRYGGSYWACMPYLYLHSPSSTSFIKAGFSSSGTSDSKALVISKSDIPLTTGVWYDVEIGWDKNTKEIYLEVSDDAGHYKKITDTLNSLYDYSTSYDYSVGMMNRNDSYCYGITFDLYNTYYEEDHSRILWGIKGG